MVGWMLEVRNWTLLFDDVTAESLYNLHHVTVSPCYFRRASPSRLRSLTAFALQARMWYFRNTFVTN